MESDLLPCPSADDVAWLTCTCCGKSIRDTADENRDHGQVPYPHDIGFGMCLECGGDKRGVGTDEASIKKRLGWAGVTFYESRFDVVRKGLNATNRAKFNAMSYGKKIIIVAGLIEKGVII